MKHKILMTLALLLTAVTGAWATDTYTITFSANGKNKTYTDVVLPAEYKCEYGSPGEFDNIIQELYEQDGGHAIENATPTVTGTDAIAPSLDGPNNYAIITITAPFTGKATVSGTYAGWSNNSGNSNINYSIEVYFGTPSSSDAIDLKWDAATKTGTFTMPAYDVEIAPIYAPTAQWATEGDAVLAPAAIEGIYAGSTDAIVKAGTVVEGQGTAMYFATTDAEMTAEKAAQADGWLATVPTAAGYDGAQTVYVWYYIKGADTPQGQTASAENTFNDSEICTTPIEVTVLNNKFDIQFNAANDNTIQAGKATVTVGGTAAEVKDGVLQGVKMNSKVTITAKDGYKFRKVEVKKVDPAKTYLKWNAGQQKLVATEIPAEVTMVENNSNDYVEWAAGTYVVEGEVTINGMIGLNGNVELIIKDGAKLTAYQIWGGPSKYNLSIYGQANQTGQLVVNSSDDAITNVNTLEVHSAKVKSTSSTVDCGAFYDIKTFNVYGGSVDAENTGTLGYGILLVNNGSMNIYGGDVKAVGKGTSSSQNSYGIKGYQSTLTVYGGKLWAESAESQGLDSNITLTKGAGFSGKIQTSDNGSSWTEYTEASTPSAKYVRVGY